MNPDHLLKLIEIYVTQRDKTKETQWKVNIGLWTLLTAAFYACLSTDYPGRLPRNAGFLLFFLPVLHGLWAWQISGSLEGDRKLIHKWRAQLLQPGNELGGIPQPNDERKRTLTWLVIQVGVTLVLTTGSFWIIQKASN